MSKPTLDDLYYYADGEKVLLTEAVNQVAVPEPGSRHVSSKLKRLYQSARRLNHDLVLLDCSHLSAEDREHLCNQTDSQPALQNSGALLVPLPEIRIEESEASKLDEICDWLTDRNDSNIISRSDERLTIQPQSGSGVDAIRLAAEIMERFHPAMAQPRFIRITARPS